METIEIKICKKIYEDILKDVELLELLDVLGRLTEHPKIREEVEVKTRKYIVEILFKMLGYDEIKLQMVEDMGEKEYQRRYKEIERKMKE